MPAARVSIVEDAPTRGANRAKAYRNYLLGVLLVLLALNTKDRLAFGLVLQSIKVDLALTDTQLGLLTGLAFAVFYSLMGIPIARWADRGNRVTIIALTTALWSVAVTLCSVAVNFLQLLVIRIGVAVGEAGGVPTAHSLIADYFTRAERPKAVAIYKLGIPLSAVMGYFWVGWLNQFYGWRVTLMLLGLPGIALALLVRFTLKEPRLNARIPQTVSAAGKISPCGPPRTTVAAQPKLSDVWRTLWTNRTFRHLLFAYSVISFFGNGISQWKAAFFIRTYGMKTGELGTWFAIIYGGFGLLGTYAGGVLATRYARNDERLQLRGAALAYSGFCAVSAGIYFSPSPYLAIALTGVAALGTYAVTGPLFAILQSLVPDRMRATSIALLLLFVNLIGSGLGPLAAGMLSDAFRVWAGADSLRYSLLALTPGYLWGALHYWRAGNTVMADLSAINSQSNSPSPGDSQPQSMDVLGIPPDQRPPVKSTRQQSLTPENEN